MKPTIAEIREAINANHGGTQNMSEADIEDLFYLQSQETRERYLAAVRASKNGYADHTNGGEDDAS
jgi:hypothetical protein